MKLNNIHIMGVRGEESEQRIETLFEELMTKNFLNPVKEKDTEVQKAQRLPNKLDPKRPTLRHIIIKIMAERQGENPKSYERKAVSHIQGSTN